MKKLVSIIVPIYKVEEYLPKCIESIIKQTYSNIEIILVNDGSPDNCGTICDEYSKKDNRIVVIHQENGGLSDARNSGIKASKGDYILFVDSDDYIDVYSVEKLVFKAEENNLDVVCGNGYRGEGKFKRLMTKINIPEDKVFNGKEYMYYRIKKGNFQASAWISLYKSSLIKGDEIYFKKDLIHEDEHWTPRIMLKAKRVMYTNFCFYYYTIRENSITNTSNKEKNIKSIVYLCNDLEKTYKKSQLEKKYLNEFCDYLSRLYMGTSYLKEYDKLFYKKLIDKKFILRNTFNISTWLKAIIYLISIDLFVFLKTHI